MLKPASEQGKGGSGSVDLDALVHGFATMVAAAVTERLADADVLSGAEGSKRGRGEGPRLMPDGRGSCPAPGCWPYSRLCVDQVW